MFLHKLLFNLVKELFKQIEGRGRSVTVRVQAESENLFTYVVYEKRNWYGVKFRAQKLAIVFQHKFLLNLVKDLFK